jgi:hypothetical protein
MPTERLPSNPNFESLKYQAKELLREPTTQASGVAERIRVFRPRFRQATDAEISNASLSLSDGQLTIACEHGFLSCRYDSRPARVEGEHLPEPPKIRITKGWPTR